MAYIDINWLTRDPIAANIIDRPEDVTQLVQEIDNVIVAAVLEEQLTVDDIAVNGSGYVTSVFLIEYGVNFGLYAFFRSYAGSGLGLSRDDVYTKRDEYWDKAQNWRGKITEDTIKGGDGSEEIPLEGFARVTYMGM